MNDSVGHKNVSGMAHYILHINYTRLTSRKARLASIYCAGNSAVLCVTLVSN